MSSGPESPWVHSFLEHSLVASIMDSFGAGTLTQMAWQLTSPAAHLAMHSVVGLGAALELVPVAVVSLWAAARPRRATMGMKACILIDCWVRNECGRQDYYSAVVERSKRSSRSIQNEENRHAPRQTGDLRMSLK